MNRCVPSLGVGLAWRPGLDGLLGRLADRVSYLRIAPGTSLLPALDECGLRLVARGSGAALMAPGPLRHDYVARLRRWHDARRFAWYSEPLNLGAACADSASSPNVWPRDGDARELRSLAPRVRKVCTTLPAPVVLDDLAPRASVEPGASVMNRLANRTGCYVALDLGRLVRDCRRYALDPVAVLAQHDLDRVVEVVTGGPNPEGHPDRGAVADLLRVVLLSCPNLGGITYVPVEADHAAVRAIDVLVTLWARYQPLPSRLAS